MASTVSVDSGYCLSDETFVRLARSRGLKEKTITVLLKEDYDSLQAILTITEEDLKHLDITMGQKGLIKKWLLELKASSLTRSVNPSHIPQGQITKGQGQMSGGQDQHDSTSANLVCQSRVGPAPVVRKGAAFEHQNKSKTDTGSFPQQTESTYRDIQQIPGSISNGMACFLYLLSNQPVVK